MASSKPPQLSLFEETTAQTEIVRISGKTLNKNQQKFNKLLDDIHKTTNELEKLQQELPIVFAELLKISKPLEDKLLAVQIKLIQCADQYYREMKLGKKQKEVMVDYILFRIQELPTEPGEEVKEIYNRYAESTYEEEQEYERQLTNEKMAAVIEMMFGMKVDIEFDPTLSEMENAARLKQHLAEKGITGFDQKAFDNFNHQSADSNRKKSKKQKEQEEVNRIRQEKEDQLRKKSFKAIYMELMKAFHPDTETDPVRKAEKEEISKKITVAYGNGDFFSLLKLEAEFLSQHEDRIQSLPQDQLSYYLKMLSGQKAELKEQLDDIKDQYAVVYEGIFRRNMPGAEFFKAHKRKLEAVEKDFQAKCNLLLFKDPSQRKLIIDGMEMELEEAMDDFSMFDF